MRTAFMFKNDGAGLGKNSARCGAALVLALALLSFDVRAQDSAIPAGPIAQAPDGQLQGKPVEGGAMFANIPFAAPPVGDLRWKPPVAAPRWTGVRAANVIGNACMQTAGGWNDVDAAHASEDCLNLNVWTPSLTGRRAVMVWIHGGGYGGGAGNTPLYDGGFLMRRGVVVVTINYRLGVFGYLAHPELAAESADHVSGNYGLQDQIAALQWVKRNIAAFGGDPSNVTVFGQSAGSWSTAILATAPQAKGLFHRAILESGTAFGGGALGTLEEAQTANANFGSIRELRQVPATELMQRWQKFSREGQNRRTAPVIDGHVLPISPGKAYLNGSVKGVDMIVGSNTREMARPMAKDVLDAAVQKAFGDSAKDALAAYEAAAAADPQVGDAAAQFSTDTSFRCGTVPTASDVGHAWLYHFGQPGPGLAAVAHSAEVIYVWGTANQVITTVNSRSFTPDEQRLSDNVQLYWTNFAKTGNPNGAGLPNWPQFNDKDSPYLFLAAAGAQAKDHFRQQACAPYIAQLAAK